MFGGGGGGVVIIIIELTTVVAKWLGSGVSNRKFWFKSYCGR